MTINTFDQVNFDLVLDDEQLKSAVNDHIMEFALRFEETKFMINQLKDVSTNERALIVLKRLHETAVPLPQFFANMRKTKELAGLANRLEREWKRKNIK